jgi:hypothetical protein
MLRKPSARAEIHSSPSPAPHEAFAFQEEKDFFGLVAIDHGVARVAHSLEPARARRRYSCASGIILRDR